MKSSRTASVLFRGIASSQICALAIAGLGSTSNAHAVTLSVRNLNDSGPGSLRQAIASAATGDTITFGVSGTITLTSGALTITRDLQVKGPGPNQLTISGNHASRVFIIRSGKVKLSGMTIANGLADAHSPIVASIGGGILNYAGLALENDIVWHNAAIGDASTRPLGLQGWAIGGGVASFGGLAAAGSQFTGNLARGGNDSIGDSVGVAVGGAIGNWGPAAISGSYFAYNLARGGDHGSGSLKAGDALGGAIGNASTLAVTGSTFSYNVASGGSDNVGLLKSGAAGGAIGSGGFGEREVILLVTGSRLDHNKAIAGNGGDAYGGGIDVWRAEGTITACTLESNEAVGGTGGSGSNGGVGAGGGIAVNSNGEGSNVTIIASRINQNSARGGDGAPGGKGGNGLGGGLTNGAGTTLMLLSTVVTYNVALGGSAGLAGSHGQGMGGGVYHLGVFNFDTTTRIENNRASTSNNNLAP